MKCYKEHIFYIGRDIENKITISLDNEKVKPKLCKCYLDNENNQNNINCRYFLINLNIDTLNYYCSNCNSFFCQNCKDNHSIIFLNNIIICDDKIRKIEFHIKNIILLNIKVNVKIILFY